MSKCFKPYALTYYILLSRCILVFTQTNTCIYITNCGFYLLFILFIYRYIYNLIQVRLFFFVMSLLVNIFKVI